MKYKVDDWIKVVTFEYENLDEDDEQYINRVGKITSVWNPESAATNRKYPYTVVFVNPPSSYDDMNLYHTWSDCELAPATEEEVFLAKLGVNQ